MGEQRFKVLGTESFFGRFVYERIVPRDHFLVKLAEVIDWEAFVPILLPAYEGQAQEGRPPYSPEVILKMLVITYLYSLSERQTEKEIWGALLATPEYQQGREERYKVERKFGEAKRWHRFGRCRYLGTRRYGIQAFLTTIALNVKRIVYLLTQIRFRPPSRKDQLALT